MQCKSFRCLNVSRGRLTGPHPGKMADAALFYLCLIGALSGYFVYSRPDAGYLVVCGALPAGLLLGLLLYGLDTVLRPLDTWLATGLGAMLAGFILVFVYIITYTVSFFLIVSFPLGLIMDRGEANLSLSQDFDLYVISFAVLTALVKLLFRGRFRAERACRS